MVGWLVGGFGAGGNIPHSYSSFLVCILLVFTTTASMLMTHFLILRCFPITSPLAIFSFSVKQ